MKFPDWVSRRIAESQAKLTRKQVLIDVAKRSGVSMMTIAPLDRGALMGQWKKALAVSQVTEGLVTVPELCEREPTVIMKTIVDRYQAEYAPRS